MLTGSGPQPESPHNFRSCALLIPLHHRCESLLNPISHHDHCVRNQRVLRTEVIYQEPRFTAYLGREGPKGKVCDAFLQNVVNGCFEEILPPLGCCGIHVTSVTCNNCYSQVENQRAEFKCDEQTTPRDQLAEEFKVTWQLVGGPGVKPGFAASDAAVLFGYTTHPLELAPGIQTGSLR